MRSAGQAIRASTVSCVVALCQKIGLSEDDTEDLCHWIVSRGLWRKVVVTNLLCRFNITAFQTRAAPTQATDWGVVEVVPSTPKHLQLEGKDCTLTATPLANGNFAVFIEGDFGVTG